VDYQRIRERGPDDACADDDDFGSWFFDSASGFSSFVVFLLMSARYAFLNMYSEVFWLFHSKVNAEGQILFRTHISHFGFFAVQTFLPRNISRSVILVHLSCGTIFMRSVSILLGSLFFVSPSLEDTRRTCVSTAIPSTMP
jgi:hypothetical protein